MQLKKYKLTFENKYLLFIVIISLCIACLIHFPELISLFDGKKQNQLFPGITSIEVMSEISFTFVSLLFLFFINTIIFKFDKPNNPIKGKSLIFSFLITWGLSSLLGKMFVYAHIHGGIPAIDAMVHLYLHPVRDFTITGLVTGSCYIIYLIQQKQLMSVENEQLQAENILNQYEVLKHQLNPHMLFNSLNTLQSLIRESPVKAQNYLQELSHVLRYTLQGNESQTVSLTDEMTFVRAYIYLLKMRYEENLIIKINLDKRFEGYQLPPMAIQVLIENAVKHNEISNRKPLSLSIGNNQEGWIYVQNNIQPKLTKGHNTGIGLLNLSKRYNLLFKQTIEINNENNLFTVRIPLNSNMQ